MNRIKNLYRRYGFFGIIKKIILKTFHKLSLFYYRILFFVKRKTNKLVIKSIISKYKKVIVFENNFGWKNLMRQRPQQVALNFNKDVLFLYHSSIDDFTNSDRLEKLADNLYIIDMNLYRNFLHDLFDPIEEKFLMIYSTDYVPENIIDIYRDNKFKIIYEYVDEIHDELCGEETGKLLRDRHMKIISDKGNYVIATSNKLFDNVKKDFKDANLLLVTNGGDYNHFSSNVNGSNDFDDIKKIDHPIIGYYGALASWFDYELIRYIANKNKNYNIVLLGMDYDKSLGKSGILKLSNVYYLGKKDYEDLPSYGSNFDVCMIPFVINDITLATSPVKLFEYMALKKPIVTTNMPECTKYESVFVAKTFDEFDAFISKALLLKNNDKYFDLLRKDAIDNRWESKCLDIYNFIMKK